MPVRAHLPGYRRLHFVVNAAVRTGLYSGVALVLIFTLWLAIANNAPILEKFALERNLIAAIALAIVALVPILRFWRFPGNLLASGLLAWGILSVSYRLLCLRYLLLAARHGATQIFTLGAMVYLIAATIAWIGSCIGRLHEAHSHSHDHLS